MSDESRTAAAVPTRPLLFHVGVHRTGTTYLQTEVFPRLRDVEFVYPKLRSGDTDLKNYDALARPELRERLLAATEVPLLVSDESLLRAGWGERSEPRLRRLRELFPGARLLLGFRRHDRWLRSLHSRYLLRNGLLRRHDLLDLERDGGPVRREDLLWCRLIEIVREWFGSAPFVFLQEELEHNLGGLLGDLCEFVGAAPLDVTTLSVEPVRASAPRGEQWRQLVRNRLGGRLGLGGMWATVRAAGLGELLATLSGRLAPRGFDARVRAEFADDWRGLLAYLRENRDGFELPAGVE